MDNYRATTHHPDKIAASEDRALSEAYFVHLKLAQDTLLHPTKRWVYDRFGPVMLDWRHCSSIRDYLLFGLRYYLPTYTTFGMAMVVAAVTGYLQWGRFVSVPLCVLFLLLPLMMSFRSGATSSLPPFFSSRSTCPLAPTPLPSSPKLSTHSSARQLTLLSFPSSSSSLLAKRSSRSSSASLS